eukprot:XP_014784196.1 PREDICTED: titin-like isoform X3 [Octopus bimaculoides]
MDLPRNSTALAEEHTKLFNTIVEVSTAALHEGRILLERVSRDDSGANGVRQKYAELQECCARVESNCKAQQAEAWEKNQAYLKFQEQYKNLHAWLTQIGLATLSRHKDLGSSLANAKDFLEIHQQLNEDVRGKATDMQALSDATDALVQSGDQEGKAAKEMYEALYQQWLKIQHIISLRIELSLIFVSFHKIIQNLAASSGIFENILKSETEDLQDITEDAVKNLQEMWSQTIKIHNDLQEKGSGFLQKTSQVTEDSNLDVAQSVTLVQKILTEYRSHITTLTEQWEIWQQRVSSSQQFKVQWHQFIQEVRKTITSITNIEKELFMPHISGQVSENKQTAEQLQKKLEDYEPILKEAEEKIKEHINTAETLSSKGDTKGQKDQIVNELVKVHQRFQARVTEYHFLLKMTIQFFGSLNQLDELINKTEQEFSTTELPSDLNQAERMLEEHKVKKSEVNQLLTHTADEGEKIVVRVRQQGADAATQAEIKRIMEISENYKRRWNQTWEEQDRRLAQNLQICQFNFDLRQIHSEIDELHHHLQARRGNYGNNLPAARMTSQAFKQFEMTVELIEKKINSFISTAELMVQDKHYDSVHIHQEIDVLKKKWSTFHTSVTDYRSLLDISVMYFQMIEETEQWVREGNQMLINIGRQATECRQPSDATTLIIKLQKFVENEKPIIEQKVNKISELSHELYGDQGANKVRHVVVSYQDLLQSFQQADNELSALKVKLEGNEASGVEEHIPMQIDIPVNEQAVVLKPPRITQHLKNAEVLEGTKFIFECHIESDEIPEVKWFKDNLPLTSPDYETRFENGVATLTIEETFSEDTARYTCRVTNQAGTAESSAHLNVKETHQQIIPPDIIKNLKSADILEGSPFTFECQITGMPTPSISWYKDDQNIDNSPDFVITKINGTCCLKIRKVTMQEGARYTCRANNAGGEASSSARLTVKPLEKPIIHEPLMNRTITEGKSISFRIVFSGVPNPEVLWFRGTEQMINSNVFKISTEHNISILDIMEAYPEDSGPYSVLVQNPAGEARSSCQLTIEQIYSSTGEEMSQSSTDVEPVKPFFSQLLQATAEVIEGSRVRLDCIIVGNPEPEVIWYHNDKPVKESKDIQLLFEGDRCTLVIREVYLEDAGLYRCVARNPHGVAESHCKLIVEALSEMSDGSGTDLVAPTFPELLTDVASKPGENVTLRCTVHGMPIPEVQWFREGILIEPSSKYKTVCNGDVHSLIIPETFGEDSGTFMVKAVNPAGEAKCYGKLLVKSEKQPGMEQLTMVRRTVEKVTTVTRTEEIKQSPPEFTKLFQDVTVKQGEPVMLECIITGTPKPKVVWQYNGDLIDIRQHQPCMEGDKYRLIIPKASERDAGRFTITAENPSGRATCSARVIVEKVLPVPMEASYQSQFTRTVTQSETRLSRIIADMQEKSMSGMEHHSTTITTQVPPKFEVMGAPVATHDRFATSITTDLAPQYQQVDLRIEVPIPPKFLQALKNITALEGTKVTFDGVVTGKPEPSIKWYKKDKEITDGADFEISYKDGRVSLTIPEVLEEQSGQVTCTASNYVGCASSTAELIVRASMIPPSFTERLQRRQVKEGESVKLTVRVAGTPAPQVMWYREGSRIVSSPDFEIIQEGDIHTLYIPEVFYEDSGKFTVKAKNPAGEAECMAELRVQAPPPPVVESFAHIKPVVPTHQADVYMRPVEPPQPIQEPVHPSPIRHVQAPVPKPVPKPAQEPALKPTHKEKPEKPSPIKSVQPPVPVPPADIKMDVDEPEQTLPPFEKRLKLFDQPAEVQEPVIPAAVKPQMKPAPHLKPSFPKPLQNVTVNEGEKVIFEVIITGNPEPVVKWFKNEKIIHNSPDFEITYINGVSRLVIAEVFAEDSGQYKCVATNVQGTNTSTAYLDVKEPISSSEESPPVSANVPQELPVLTPVPVVQVPTASPILGVRKVPFKIPSPAPVPKPPPPPPVAEEPFLEPKKKPTVKFGAPVTQPPRFIEPLQNAMLIEGINVMLECTVIGKPFPQIMWTHFGLPVIEDENHHVYTDVVTGRCTFLISKSTLRDKGDYTCTAQNIAGQDATSAVLVEAPSVPKLIDGIDHAPKKPVPKPEHVPVKKVDDKLAKPAPQDFKSSAFEERLKQEIQFREGKIHFTSDVGSTSEYDSEHPEDKVSVGKEHPRITQTLKNFRLIEGSDVTFVCKVTGKPRPKIAWYKNGVRMKRSGRCDMKYTHDGYCTLKIRLAIPEDAGHYTVLAVNSTGRDTCSAELYVDSVGTIDATSFVEPETLERMLKRDQDKINQSAGGGGVFEKASKPAFQVIPENQEARDGQTVRFDCLVTGRPYPEISWYKNEIEMRSDDYHKVVVNENGIHSLIILSATRQDHGQYRCVARNKAGEAVFFVTLNVMERQEIHPPHFVERLQNYNAKENQTVTLTCTAVGCPLPMMSWQKDARMLSSKDYDISTENGRSTLTIKNATPADSAWFQCSAVNVAGSALTRARLNVIGKGPQQPITTPEAPMFGVRRSTSPKYEIQPIGPVQQISYATEHDSATLRLLREDPLRSEEIPAPIDEMVVCAPAPTTETPVDGQPTEDEPAFKPPSVAEAKLIFDQSGKPLPPPATLPRVQPKPEFIPKPVPKPAPVQEKLISPDKKVKPVKAPVPVPVPVPAESTLPRGDSPPSYEIQEEGPVQQISYASEIGSAVLKIVDQVDIMRDEDKPVRKPTPAPELTKPSKVEPYTAPKPAPVPEPKPAPIIPAPPVIKHVESPKLSKKPVQPPAAPKPPPITPVAKVPVAKPPQRKRSPKPVTDNEKVANANVKTPWNAANSEVYKALMEEKTARVSHDDLFKMEAEIQLQKMKQESHIRRRSVHPTEIIYNKSKKKRPVFRTQLKDVEVAEYDRTHLECLLTPINDPTMKVEWLRNGQPLPYGHRYRPVYEFGYVVLDLLFTIPEDSGIYSIKATNAYGEATINAEVVCLNKTSIIIGTQLPEGQEAIARLRQLESYKNISLMVGNYAEDADIPSEPAPPIIEIKPEPVEIDEGETAKFIVNVSGYPRPRVTWWINGSLVAGGSRFKVRYDGVIHYLEIPRVREYDAGQIRVLAKNQQGEAECITTLKVIPKEDWRSHLRHAPKSDLQIELERRKRVELRSAELKMAQMKSSLASFELGMLKHETTFRKDTTDANLQKLLAQDALRQQLIDEQYERIQKTSTQTITFKQPVKQEPPVFGIPLCPVKVLEGTSVTLKVHFTSNPPPIITWYRDSIEIHNSWDFQIRVTETCSTLHISEVFPEDSGMYTVKAYNKYGMTQCKAKMTVMEEEEAAKETSPEFRNLLRDTKVVVGEPATFDCEVIGKPKPKVHWQKDGKNMPESPRWKFIHEENHYTLLIFEVQPEDAGTYACVSINTNGKSTCTAKLIVDEPDVTKESHAHLKLAKQVKATPPTIMKRPENKTVPESESVSFSCKITSNPPPVVTWYCNNHLVKPSKYFNMTSTPDGVHTLTLLEAFPEDRGQYRCVARNVTGEISCVCYLNVIGLESETEPETPEVPVSPPSFIKPISNIVIEEGYPTYFEAVFTGEPDPEITWLRNGKKIKNTRDFKIERVGQTTILSIREAFPEDSGLITCRARNSAGVAECSAEFYVQEEQELPEDKVSRAGMKLVQPKIPVFKRSLSQTYKVKRGQIARLEAQVEAYPPPLVKWYVNGVEILPSDHYQMFQEGDTVVLIIIHVDEKDIGEYVLRVGNELGEITCRTTITFDEKQKVVQIPDEPDSVTIKMIEKEEKTITTEIREIRPIFVEPIQPEVFVRERGIARLECSVDAHPPPLITWYINGMEIKPSPHYEIFYESGKSLLIIIDVGPEDTGEYTCRAVSELGEAVCSTTLYVQEPAAEMSPPPETEEEPPVEDFMPPNFIKDLETMDVVDGQEIKMICKVVGKPVPHVSWFHNGTNIDNNDEYVISYNPETGDICLHIVEALPEDRGDYVCMAINQYGQAATSARLTVHEPKKEEVIIPVQKKDQKAKPAAIPPEFVEPLQPQTVQDGSQVVLTCRMNAYPEPKITWYKDSIEIVPNNDFQITFEIETGRCKLIITEVYPEDAGEYTCHARNIYGESVTSTTVIVETSITTTETTTKSMTTIPLDESIKLVDEHYITSIQMSPHYIEPTEVYHGKPVRLICQLTGEPNVSWYINEVEVRPTPNRKMFIEHNTSILLIVNATYEDTGEYICRMENKEGVSISRASINVMKQIEAPLTEPAAPEFTELLQPYTVHDGDRAEFRVRFTGQPLPKITWFYDGKVITSTNDIQITVDYERKESILIIVEVFPEDEGEYTCSASNEYGETITTCKLTVTSSSGSEAIESDETHKQTIIVDQPQIVELPDETVYQEHVEFQCDDRRESETDLFYDAPEEVTQTEEIRTISTTTSYFEQTEEVPADVKATEKHTTTLTVDQKEKSTPVELRFQVSEPVTETRTEIHESTHITSEEIPAKDDVVIERENIHKETIEILHKEQPESEPAVLSQKEIQPVLQPQRIEVEVKEHVMKMKSPEVQVVLLPDTVDAPVSEAVEIPAQTDVPLEVVEIPAQTDVPVVKAVEILAQADVLVGEAVEIPTQTDVPAVEAVEIPAQTDVPVEVVEMPAQTDVPVVEIVEIPAQTDAPVVEVVEIHAQIDKPVVVEVAEIPAQTVDMVSVSRETIVLKKEEQPVVEEVIKEEITEKEKPVEKEVVEKAGKAPIFTWHLTSLKVMDGEEVKFYCEIDGQPMPEIVWYHEEVPISENQDFKSIYNKETGSCSLLISEVFPQDAGEYKCEATNALGTAVSRAYLEIESYEYIPDSEEASSQEAPSPRPVLEETELKQLSYEEVKKLIQEETSVAEVSTELPGTSVVEKQYHTAKTVEMVLTGEAESTTDISQKQIAEFQVTSQIIKDSIQKADIESPISARAASQIQIPDQSQLSELQSVSEEQVKSESVISVSQQHEAGFATETKVVEKVEDLEQPQIFDFEQKIETPVTRDIVQVEEKVEQLLAEESKVSLETVSVDQPQVFHIVSSTEEQTTIESVPGVTKEAEKRQPTVAKSVTMKEVTEESIVTELHELPEATTDIEEITLDIHKVEEKHAKESKVLVEMESLEQPEVVSIDGKVQEQTHIQKIVSVTKEAEKQQPTVAKSAVIKEVTEGSVVTELQEFPEETTDVQEITLDIHKVEEKYAKETKVSVEMESFEQPEVFAIDGKVEEQTNVASIPGVTFEVEKQQPTVAKSVVMKELTEESVVTQLHELPEETTEMEEITLDVRTVEEKHAKESIVAVGLERVEQPEVFDIDSKVQEQTTSSEVQVIAETSAIDSPVISKSTLLSEDVPENVVTHVKELDQETTLGQEIVSIVHETDQLLPKETKVDIETVAIEHPDVFSISESVEEKTTVQEIDKVITETIEKHLPTAAKTVAMQELIDEATASDVQEEVEEKTVPDEVSSIREQYMQNLPVESKAAVEIELIEHPEILNLPEKTEYKPSTQEIKQVTTKPEKTYPTSAKAFALEEMTEHATTMDLEEAPVETLKSEGVTSFQIQYEQRVERETQAAPDESIIEVPEVVNVAEKVEQKLSSAEMKVVKEMAEKSMPIMSKSVTLEEFTESSSIISLDEETSSQPVVEEVTAPEETTGHISPKTAKSVVLEEIFEIPEVKQLEENKTESMEKPSSVQDLDVKYKPSDAFLTQTVPLEEVVEELKTYELTREVEKQTDEREVSPLSNVCAPLAPSESKADVTEELLEPSVIDNVKQQDTMNLSVIGVELDTQSVKTQPITETTTRSVVEAFEQPNLTEVTLPSTETAIAKDMPIETLQAQYEEVPEILETFVENLVTEVISETVEESKMPSFEVSLKDITVVENHVLHMEVFVSGTPMPEVKWYLNQVELAPSPGVHIRQEGYRSEYIVEEVFPEDQGLYSVIATNEFGTVTSSAYITVLSASGPSSDVEIEEEQKEVTKTFVEEISIDAKPVMEQVNIEIIDKTYGIQKGESFESEETFEECIEGQAVSDDSGEDHFEECYQDDYVESEIVPDVRKEEHIERETIVQKVGIQIQPAEVSNFKTEVVLSPEVKKEEIKFTVSPEQVFKEEVKIATEPSNFVDTITINVDAQKEIVKEIVKTEMTKDVAVESSFKNVLMLEPTNILVDVDEPDTIPSETMQIHFVQESKETVSEEKSLRFSTDFENIQPETSENLAINKAEITAKSEVCINEILDHLTMEKSENVIAEASPVEMIVENIESDIRVIQSVEKPVQNVELIPEVIAAENADAVYQEPTPVEPTPEVIESKGVEQHVITEKHIQNVAVLPEDLPVENVDIFPREPSPVETTPEVIESKGVEQHVITEKHIQNVAVLPEDLPVENVYIFPREPSPVETTPEVIESKGVEQHVVTEKHVQNVAVLPEVLPAENVDIFPREPSPVETTPEVIESKGVEQHMVTEKHVQNVAVLPEVLPAENVYIFPREPSPVETTPEVIESKGVEKHMVTEKHVQNVAVLPEDLPTENVDIFPREPSPVETTSEVIESKGVEQHMVTEKHVQNVTVLPEDLAPENVEAFPREPSPVEVQSELIESGSKDTHELSEKLEINVEGSSEDTILDLLVVVPREESPVGTTFDYDTTETTKEQVLIVQKEIKVDELPDTTVIESSHDVIKEVCAVEPVAEIVPSSASQKPFITQGSICAEEIPQETEIDKLIIIPREIPTSAEIQIAEITDMVIPTVSEEINVYEDKPVEVEEESFEDAAEPSDEEKESLEDFKECIDITVEPEISAVKKEIIETTRDKTSKVMVQIKPKEEKAEKTISVTNLVQHEVTLAEHVPVVMQVEEKYKVDKTIPVTSPKKSGIKINVSENIQKDISISEASLFKESVNVVTKPQLEEIHMEIVPEKKVDVKETVEIVRKVTEERIPERKEEPVDKIAVFKEAVEISPKPGFQEVHMTIVPEKKVEVKETVKVVQKVKEEITPKKKEEPVDETAVFKEGLVIAPKPTFEEVHMTIVPEKKVDVNETIHIVQKVTEQITPERREEPVDETAIFKEGLEITPKPKFEEVHMTIVSKEKDIPVERKPEMHIEVRTVPEQLNVTQKETYSIETIASHPKEPEFEKEIRIIKKDSTSEIVKQKSEYIQKTIDISEIHKKSTKLEVIKEFHDISVREKDTFILEIIFEAHPAPSITWYFEDVVIESTEEFLIVIEENRTMIVVKQAILEDEGEYKVRIENDAGSYVSTAYVTVLPLSISDTEFETQRAVVSEQEKMEIKQEFHKFEINIDVSSRGAPPKPEPLPVAEVKPLLERTETTTIITEQKVETVTESTTKKETTEAAPSEGGEPTNVGDASMQTFLLAMIMVMMFIRFMAWLLSFGCCFWCCFFCCLWQS